MTPRSQSPLEAVRAFSRTAAFVLRVMPMLPSEWLDRRSPVPRYEQVVLPGRDARVPCELYCPAGTGPFAGVVVCLGVIPFDVTHPQVKRLGTALARSGFATLIVWSSDMRSLRIAPRDTELLVDAFRWLSTQSFVDPKRCGFLGTCVGAGFSLLAAADTGIRDRVAFLTCFAPFGTLRTLALDIGSGTTEIDGIRRAWDVDQLSRHVYVRTLTAGLDPGEAARLETAWFERLSLPDAATLSPAGRELLPLLQTTDRARLAALLDRHPTLRATVDAVSPVAKASEVLAPSVSIGHDYDDGVIPFGESQRLFAAFAGRPGVALTTFHLFQHADPTKRAISPIALLGELLKFARFAGGSIRYAADGHGRSNRGGMLERQ
ncbi:MAG: hypothetical protein R2855_03345 [Thermomicrobiales bacterium]